MATKKTAATKPAAKKAAPAKSKNSTLLFNVNQSVKIKPGYIHAGLVFQIDIVRTVKNSTDYLLCSGSMSRQWFQHDQLEAV